MATAGVPTTAADSGDISTAADSGDISTAAAVAQPVTRRRRRRWVRPLLWVLAVPVALLVLLVAAWAVDQWVGSEDVARNTELAGTAVGGLGPADLAGAVDDLAAELPGTEVLIDAGDLQLETTAGELGLAVDAEATTDTAMDVGRTGPLVQRPFEWLGSFVTPRSADVVVTTDRAELESALTRLEGEDRRAPTEPTLVVDGATAGLQSGVDGIELTADAVIEALPPTLGDVSDRIVIEVERTPVPPAMDDAVMQSLVDQANTLAERTITVRAGEQVFSLAGESLMEGVSVDTSGPEPVLVVAPEVIEPQVAAQEGLDGNPTGVTFTSGGGGLVPVAGRDVEICCGEGAAETIVFALLAGDEEVEVPSRTYTAQEGVEWASGLGVRQVVAEFTTPHACCQPRVQNIHRISDIIRGTLIAPGDTFSVNATTGARTEEKGFVAAPAIIDGEYVDDVGGGVSQFGTTAFNAAFFAGLDITAYKMHSEYISRYPYAREATLFYPGVDLKIRNNTPFGVVVWPTYNDTSVTVQLWSTPFARGEQTGQSQSSGCGSVTTERTTTFPDGTSEVDTFRANYRCV